MDTNIADALGSIQRSLGNIEGTMQGMKEAFERHVADDDLVEGRVRVVEEAMAKQRGRASVWGIVSNLCSALIGAAAAYFGAKHG